MSRVPAATTLSTQTRGQQQPGYGEQQPYGEQPGYAQQPYGAANTGPEQQQNQYAAPTSTAQNTTALAPTTAWLGPCDFFRSVMKRIDR